MYCKAKKNSERSEKFWIFFFQILWSKFSKKKFQKFSDHSEEFFCFTIHKKLNKSCSLEFFFLFLKKKSCYLKNLLKFYEVRSKGGISIDADFGPPRYVLWCCGGICHQLLTFFQIDCGHTVGNALSLNDPTEVSNYRWRCQLSYETHFVWLLSKSETPESIVGRWVILAPTPLLNWPKNPHRLGLMFVIKPQVLIQAQPI